MRLSDIPVAFLLCFEVFGGDWPQFLGPHRNGHADNVSTALLGKSTELKPAWKSKVGEGFSGPVAFEEKVLLFHRVGDQEIIDAFDATTGETKWRYAYPTKYRDDFGFDEGPRATPCIAHDRVFTLGAEGMISAVDFQTGKKIWAVDAKKEFNADKGFFGIACSPLVEGENVILNIGGDAGAGIVALDAATGKLRWKATEDDASYSSPVAATIHGQRRILFFTREGLAGLTPDGQLQFSFPWRPRSSASVSGATPLVSGDHIFLTASYETGAILLQVSPENKLRKVWSGDNILSSHYATPVIVGEHLYGFDGRQEFGPTLACVQLVTGKPAWRKDRFGAGTITALGDKLLILLESGELVLAAANPSEYKELARMQILGSTVRAYPAVTAGFLFARDKNTLVGIRMK